jgi:DNA-binding response OmpR family regulator
VGQTGQDLTGITVLVADDEPSLRAMVAECVRDLGGRTIEARDGLEAWELTRREQPDVVVLDVMMPGMSGWEVCRLAKTEGTTSGGGAPKVLMLTGIGERLNEMTSPLFAADDWIDKPFSLAQLVDKVQRLARAAAGGTPIPPPSPSGPGPNLVKAAPRDDGKMYGRAHAPDVAAKIAGAVRIHLATPAASTPSKSQARKLRKRRRKQLKAKAKARAVAVQRARAKAAAKSAARRKPAVRSGSKKAPKRAAAAKPKRAAAAKPAVRKPKKTSKRRPGRSKRGGGGRR